MNIIDPKLTPVLPSGAFFERLIAHWTGGPHTVTSLDREHYHFITAGNGSIVPGVSVIPNAFKPARRGYAAHTLGTNSRSLGVSVAAMLGAVEGRTHGSHPITALQWANFIRLIAQLCRTYNIPITDMTVLTHAEVQTNLNRPQKGKWDISVLPFDPKQPRGAKAVGDRMRAEVRAILKAGLA